MPYLLALVLILPFPALAATLEVHSATVVESNTSSSVSTGGNAGSGTVVTGAASAQATSEVVVEGGTRKIEVEATAVTNEEVITERKEYTWEDATDVTIEIATYAPPREATTSTTIQLEGETYEEGVVTQVAERVATFFENLFSWFL